MTTARSPADLAALVRLGALARAHAVEAFAVLPADRGAACPAPAEPASPAPERA